MISRGKRFFLKSETVSFSKQKKKINLGPLFLIVLLGLFIYFVIFSNCFKINNFIYDGIDSPEIQKTISENLTGRNILLMMPGVYLEKLAKQYPALEMATIVRGLPHTLKFTAKERSQSLIWCDVAECYEVDRDGIAFKKIDRPGDKIIINDLKDKPIVIGDKIISKSFVLFYLDSISQIPKKFGLKIKEAQIGETTFTVTFLLEDNRKIIMDSSQSLENQLYSLDQTWQAKKDEIKEYVDIRIPGTIYFK